MLAASMSDDDSRTLYLRNVPDQVVEQLAHMARRERVPLNAYVVRQLTAIAEQGWLSNTELLSQLPEHVRVPVEHLLAGIHRAPPVTPGDET